MIKLWTLKHATLISKHPVSAQMIYSELTKYAFYVPIWPYNSSVDNSFSSPAHDRDCGEALEHY